LKPFRTVLGRGPKYQLAVIVKLRGWRRRCAITERGVQVRETKDEGPPIIVRWHPFPKQLRQDAVSSRPQIASLFPDEELVP
jgi:hypothetical protein